MKKGLELPISTLVMLAVAIIVLLSVVAFFMGAFGGTSEGMQAEQHFRNCCRSYVISGQCGSDDPGLYDCHVDLDNDGDTENLQDLANLAGIYENIEKACGCYSSGDIAETGGNGGTTP